MDTPTNAAGSSPAPDTTPAVPATSPAPAAPVVPSPAAPKTGPTAAEAHQILGQLTPTERRDFTLGRRSLQQIAAARPQPKGAAPAPTAAAPTPAPAATPAATSPEPTPTPTAAPATPANPEDPNGKSGDQPDRFRFKEPQDQAIALIAKTRGVSLLEAARIYQSETGTPQPPAAPATPAEPQVDPQVAAFDTQLSELQSKLKTLSDQRKKARDDIDNEKADSLSDEIAEVRANITLLTDKRATFAHQSEAHRAATVERQIIASRDRAFTQYPELQAEGSLHRLALDAYVNTALNDPKRATEFADPTWPEKITAEFARKHNLKTGAAPATPAAPASPAPAAAPQPALRPKVVQVPGAKLVSFADGSHPSGTVAPTLADLQRDLPAMKPAQRKAILFGCKSVAAGA